MKQSRVESAIEISLNYTSGFIIAWAVYKYIILPNHDLAMSAFYTTLVFTLVSVVRGYLWRRFFNSGIHKLIIKFLTRRK